MGFWVLDELCMDLVQFPVDEGEYSTGLYFHAYNVRRQKDGRYYRDSLQTGTHSNLVLVSN